MDRNMTITISGGPKSGKSTLAKMLAATLRTTGYTVEVPDDEREDVDALRDSAACTATAYRTIGEFLVSGEIAGEVSLVVDNS